MEIAVSLPRIGRGARAGFYGPPLILPYTLPRMELVMLFSRSSVGTATGYGVDGQEIRGRFPVGARDLSVLQSVQTG
jgi:hypothetical protein